MGGRSAAAHRARRHHAVHHAGLSSSASAQSCFELDVEVAQFVSAHVADRNESKALITPALGAEALYGLTECCRVTGVRRRPYEQIDDVNTTAINDRGHRLAVDGIEPPADQGKALCREVDHRRR